MIEVKPLGGADKLFIDQATHLPLMVSYEGVLPRMMVRGGAARWNAGPTPTRRRCGGWRSRRRRSFEVRYAD